MNRFSIALVAVLASAVPATSNAAPPFVAFSPTPAQAAMAEELVVLLNEAAAAGTATVVESRYTVQGLYRVSATQAFRTKLYQIIFKYAAQGMSASELFSTFVYAGGSAKLTPAANRLFIELGVKIGPLTKKFAEYGSKAGAGRIASSPVLLRLLGDASLKGLWRFAGVAGAALWAAEPFNPANNTHPEENLYLDNYDVYPPLIVPGADYRSGSMDFYFPDDYYYVPSSDASADSDVEVPGSGGGSGGSGGASADQPENIRGVVPSDDGGRTLGDACMPELPQLPDTLPPWPEEDTDDDWWNDSEYAVLLLQGFVITDYAQLLTPCTAEITYVPTVIVDNGVAAGYVEMRDGFWLLPVADEVMAFHGIADTAYSVDSAIWVDSPVE